MTRVDRLRQAVEQEKTGENGNYSETLSSFFSNKIHKEQEQDLENVYVKYQHSRNVLPKKNFEKIISVDGASLAHMNLSEIPAVKFRNDWQEIPDRKITGAIFNNQGIKKLETNLIELYDYTSGMDRCGTAETAECIDKIVILKLENGQAIQALTSYNEEEHKLSLMFKENLKIGNDKILWAEVFYNLDDEQLEDEIIKGISSFDNQSISIDLQDYYAPLLIEVVRKYSPKLVLKNCKKELKTAINQKRKYILNNAIAFLEN